MMVRGMVAMAAALALTPGVAFAGAVGLSFRYSDGSGHRKAATLRCDSKGPRATGYLRHRNAAKLCARAYALEHFLSTPPPKNRVCSLIYGGPDRATVRGFVRGSRVRRTFTRVDGCAIADWNRERLLLPRPVGAR
jgi:hypothetical protein